MFAPSAPFSSLHFLPFLQLPSASLSLQPQLPTAPSALLYLGSSSAPFISFQFPSDPFQLHSAPFSSFSSKVLVLSAPFSPLQLPTAPFLCTLQLPSELPSAPPSSSPFSSLQLPSAPFSSFSSFSSFSFFRSFSSFRSFSFVVLDPLAPFSSLQPPLRWLLQLPSVLFSSLQLPSAPFSSLQLHSAPFSYLQLPSATFSYLISSLKPSALATFSYFSSLQLPSDPSSPSAPSAPKCWLLQLPTDQSFWLVLQLPSAPFTFSTFSFLQLL